MKSRLILLATLLSTFGLAQIPNAGFETWILDDFYLEPEGWSTSNTEIESAVTQDLDSYEGVYAMKVTAIPNGLSASGFAQAYVPIDYIPASLNFYAKTEVEFGAVSVAISFYNQDFLFETFEWTISEDLENWTFVSLEMPQYEPVLTHAFITVTAYYGDLVPGTAWISVDAMGISQTLNSEEKGKIRFSMFPNPATDQVQLDNLPEKAHYRIMDCLGKTMVQKAIRNTNEIIYLDQFNPGIYLVEVINGEKRATRRLVVQ